MERDWSMTARIIEIDISEDQARDGFMFHCPLTGTPVVGDREQSFEQFASPYFLFCITQDGVVQSRSDELPEPVASGLKKAIDTLSDAGRSGPDGICTHELHSFVPNVIADALPESTVIFEIGRAIDRRNSDAETWVAMDFTLPAKRVDEGCIDHSADVMPVE
ncbi:MAG: hypothetical protein U5L08_07930 [Xanthomonadales bacterium]|nr:hypothetical protein [Xanthomonadales bacterium]